MESGTGSEFLLFAISTGNQHVSVLHQARRMHLFLLLSCLVTCYGKYQDDDWIDPTDMLHYDAAAGRMKHQKQYHTGETGVKDSAEQTQSTCQSDHFDCETDTNNWKQKDRTEKEANGIKDDRMCQDLKADVESLKKEIEEWRKKGEIPQSSCNPVFRRFLYRIINEAKILGLPDESQSEVHFDAELVLTKQMLQEFLKFLDDTDWNAGPLDEALGGTLVRFKQHNEEEWSWKFEDYIGTDPFTAFMISLSMLCIVMVIATELWTRVSWFTQIRRLLALCFLVSIVWNWMYLYRDAFAERQAKLTKIGNDHTCGKQMTWSESLFEWWKSSSSFQNDPCEEYFKALMINPILLVPPTKAFAVTFTNFITEPLKHVGKGLGEFFHALLSEMPLFYQPIVLIIIALLLLAFCYGFGTTVHRMTLRRNPDEERERLSAPNPQRERFDGYIEGRDGRFFNNPQPFQPQPVEGHRDVLNRRPEILYPMDRGDINNRLQEFVETDSATRKQRAIEKRTPGQNISDEFSGQLQRKDDHLDQQPVKEALGDSPLGSQDQWKESVKDSKPLDAISPISQDVSGSQTEVKDGQLPDVETLGNMRPMTEELTVRETSSEEKKNEQFIKDDPKDHVENRTLLTSAGHVGTRGTTFDPVDSHPQNIDLNMVDLYTDPANDEHSESLFCVT